MLKTKISPWINGEEFEHVYKELYSGDPDLQQHAIGRIAVWKCRSGPSLPIAVESTMTLVRARLEHQTDDTLTTRQLYSMALISVYLNQTLSIVISTLSKQKLDFVDRFINHITERGQTKQFAVSIHQLASQLGLPDWIVDLRHEATHGALPSFGVLTTAVDCALEWLKTEYWEKQIQAATTDSDSADGQMDTLRDMLVTYQQQQFAAPNGAGSGADSRLIKDLQSVLKGLGAGACSCLLDDGYLVCTVEQLTSLGISTTDLMNGPSLLPKTLVQFWKPLLDLLSRCGLVVPFLMRMASMVTDEPTVRNKILYGWMYTIVDASQPRKSKSNHILTLRSHTRIPYKQLLRKCVQVDSIYSKDLISLLLRQLEPAMFNGNNKVHLENIMDIYHGDTMEENDTDTVVHTLTDIEQSASTKNKWEVYMERYDWSTCPIGRLPNQELGYKTLEIDSKGVDMEHPVEMEESISQRDEFDEPLPQMAEDPLTSLPQMTTECGWTEDQLKSISQQICVF